MVRIAGEIAAEYGMSRAGILADMAQCSVRYYAGYYDYHEWDYHLMSGAERRTFLTRPQSNQLSIRYNDLGHAPLFRNKVNFNRRFAEFVGRDWLDARESEPAQLAALLARHGRVMLKDPENLGGYGLEKVSAERVATDFDGDAARWREHLLSTRQFLVEQFLTQHAELERLAPGSVNTLRIVTFFDGERSHVLTTAFKMGNGADLDNFGQGGIQSTVYEGGLLRYGAFDKAGRKFVVHPLSGVPIVGFTVPFFDAAVELAERMSRAVPEVPYVGWDVAITPDGPVAIEGNYNSGVFQMKPSLSGLREGVRPRYQAAMKF